MTEAAAKLGLLSAEELERRDNDPEVLKEIRRDRKDRLAFGKRLREQEEAERQALQDRPAELARRELARRALCQQNFLPFVMRFSPEYDPGWVHKDICRRLEQFSEDVADRLSPRLLLTMPPRHGKSELTSKKFPAWHLGKFPKHEVMATSYSGSLSMGFSRINREILRDPAYHVLFETRLSHDSQGAEAWTTTEGGGYTSAGVGGAITGKGAHVLVIDDPVKNREDAESEASRENTWNWYTSTAYTRLAPGGGVLVILTRWHDDDLAGRLITAMGEGADQWEIVNYPAEAKEDEPYRKKGMALHPARYDTKALRRIQKMIGPRDWAALYQQDPVPEEGAYFNRDNIVWYDYDDPVSLPPADTMVEYSAWDLAIGQRQENDFSVGGVVSVDQHSRLWVRDVWRGHWGAKDLCTKILDLHVKWRCNMYGIEKGMIEMSIGPFLEEMKKERKLWDFYYHELKPGKQDKVARARAIQGMFESGKVHIPYNAPWTDAFVNELLRFPTGVNDDQVDFIAWIGMMLMVMAPATLIKKKKPSWRDKLAKFKVNDTTAKSAMSA
ncbi:phage terminase large subunit [Kineobactrum salinum]|uniref:Phage terminase large subunit n=1 Tax=Kineobactrum salinum TaxID=2708301 RepID=A0A6C0U4S9_9GAMM|nr:phage terminase large subunit [Kineobactrum salinum]QIB67160.1 phage terminase large subunit [Kineobactrum salinum]